MLVFEYMLPNNFKLQFMILYKNITTTAMLSWSFYACTIVPTCSKLNCCISAYLVKLWYVNNISYAVFMTSANLNQLQLTVIDSSIQSIRLGNEK